MSEAEYALGTYCGVTFAGIKAASLFSIKRECARCMGKYIKHFKGRGVNFFILRHTVDRVLLYVYNCAQMEKILSDKDNKEFLGARGYDYDDIGGALKTLKEHMSYEEFPHEVGIFLGYPLDDVKGFIAHPNDDVQLVGYWKVYSDAERKKNIFARYDKCTENIVKKLTEGIPLERIFCSRGAYHAAN